MKQIDAIIGEVLEGGWEVRESFSGYTGHFSGGYIAVNVKSDEKAFLKVCDLDVARNMPGDFLENIKILTDTFIFERDLLKECGSRKLKRVVKAYGYGDLPLSNTQFPIPYIIFEYAENIAKSVLQLSETLDHAILLRYLHGVFLGIQQLHAAGIAHQDIKPSNVLVFEGDTSKIADLGRASKMGSTIHHDSHIFPGDRAYAPPEFAYGQVSQDWNERRFASDLYMLGSLIIYFYTEVQLTIYWRQNIPSELKPAKMWRHYEQVIPALHDCFSNMYDVLEPRLAEEFREPMMEMVRQLTNADPKLRGYPKFRQRQGNSYNLEPYVSKLGSLAKRAEYMMSEKLVLNNG